MSIRAARKKLLRWERYSIRCERIVGPENLACRGHERAYNRWARATNTRNWLETRRAAE